MFGALSLFFWAVILCLCGFDSLDKNREKNRLRKDAEKKGYAYYWANGKMYHTTSNKQCYSMADENNDMILYEVGTGIELCNASEVARQRQNLIYEKRKKLNDTLEKFDQLPEDEKNKIRTKITDVQQEKRLKELESKAKSTKSTFIVTTFIVAVGWVLPITLMIQDGFVNVGCTLLYIAISACCIPLYTQMKKAEKEYKEELR